MNEFGTYEYAVRQKTEGLWILARAGLIFLYAAVVVLWLVFGLVTRIFAPLLAFIPLSVWILWFFTWRYVNVEHEYSVTSGILTYTKVFGGRSRKKILEIPLRDASLIAPLNEEGTARGAAWKPEREFVAVSSFRSPDVYFLLYERKDEKSGEKRRTVFYFEATQKMLQICRFYAPSSVVLGETRF